MKKLFLKLFAILANFVTRYEYRHQKFLAINERPIEYAFVLDCINDYQPAHVLDVGSGKSALPQLIRTCGPLVTAIDNIYDYWPKGMINRHYHVQDIDITAPEIDLAVEFDMITCVSVLEHIEQFETAVRNMMDLLPIGGHLLLTFPYSEKGSYVENVYDLPGSNAYGKNIPFICQSFTRRNIDIFVNENGGRIYRQRYWLCWSGPYWTVGERTIPPRRTAINGRHHLTCVLIRKIAER